MFRDETAKLSHVCGRLLVSGICGYVDMWNDMEAVSSRVSLCAKLHGLRMFKKYNQFSKLPGVGEHQPGTAWYVSSSVEAVSARTSRDYSFHRLVEAATSEYGIHLSILSQGLTPPSMAMPRCRLAVVGAGPLVGRTHCNLANLFFDTLC